jgi:uncharacterized RDD family membrane protein YckC
MPRRPRVEYASPAARLLAMFADALLLLFLFTLFRFLPVLIDPVQRLAAPAAAEPWLITPASLLIAFGLAMLITALFWNRLAGTPGKLLLGVRVISLASGRPPTLGRALLRFAAYLVSLLPASLGFLWSFWDKRAQGFHDKLSGTIVIVDDEANKPLGQLLEEAQA